MGLSGRRIFKAEEIQDKGHEARACPVSSRNSKEASVVGAQQTGKKTVEEAREIPREKNLLWRFWLLL